jgi:hypothetical protein
MALWVGRITLTCPKGRVVRKLTGTPDQVIRNATTYDAAKAGAGCAIEKIEIVKRGIGAGHRDRYEGERIEGARRGRRARWAPDLGADSHLMTGAYRHVSSFGGASRRKRRKKTRR